MIPLAEGSVLKAIVMPLFTLNVYALSPHTTFTMAYPPVPWLGIMLVRFASGKFFELAEGKRKKLFLQIGLGALALFVIIRFLNIYGDAVQWSSQKNNLYTLLSFMNVTKYPPSLLFCLVTLGIMFLILALAEKLTGPVKHAVSVYGKVPLFYFLVHFYFIHLILVALMFIQGFSWHQLDFASGTFGRPKGIESGVSLWAIYLIWMSVVLILYKPCVWFGKYKATHTQWWLRYI
jgi:uncharacterized membrane protein